jgi:membrane protein required for colicin V production
VNFIDIVVLVVVGISALIAFSSGFVNVVLWILSWVGAVAATVFFFPTFRPMFEKQISDPLFANIATAVAIFLVALIVCTIINQIISRMVRGSAVGALDRSLGLILGLIIGVIIVCGAFLLLNSFAPDRKDWPDSVKEARTLPMVERGAVMLKNMVPEIWIEKGSAFIDQGAKTLGEPDNIIPGKSAPAGGNSGGDSGTPPASTPGASGQTQGSNANPGGNPDGQADASGYKDAQRNDLNRLIESSQ